MAATDALARKYRPQNWDEVFGNEALVSMIKQKLEDDALPHAILLVGEKGTGKTSVSRLISKSLGCSEQNIFEYNMSDTNGVDDMRKIISTMYLSPVVERGGKKIKVYILDEFHRATPAAQDCLLKPLEEPPDFIYWFLSTTEERKVIDTIRSRCARYETKPLAPREMNELIDCILEAEGKEIDRKVQSKIVINSKGSSRNALVALETIIDIKDIGLAIDLIDSGIENIDVLDICRLLAKGGTDLWAKIAPMIDKIKIEPETCRLGILGYLARVAISDPAKASKMWIMADAFREPIFHTGKSQLIFQLINACSMAK